jgi:hypothetical protein
MCWNADISINTFLFAIFALVFIFLANTYTKYKQETFKNPLVYLLLLEVASIQLIEFFLWKNLKNKKMNEFLTSLALYIIIIEPLTIMLMIPNKIILISIVLCYLLFLLLSKSSSRITSVKNGHLSWGWITNKYKISIFIYLFFFVFSMYLINNFLLFLFAIFTLIITLFFYFKDNTFGSMWCWSTNLFLLYFIIDIIIIKPFNEYTSC